ncbi:MAG: efflux RND transporter periplasmic adaptor subunit [Candidatus Latescibacterota bacterium]
MNEHPVHLMLMIGGAFLASLWGCAGDPGHEGTGPVAARVVTQAAATTEGPPEGSDRPAPGSPDAADPEEAATEVSDLDRPVAELVALRCEHGTATHQCSECRYEVGMVKVAPGQLAAGLVQTQSLSPRRLAVPFELVGRIAFNERSMAHVSPAVAGLIWRIQVDLGQRVVAGQPLVQIKSAELATAQGEWLEAQALLRLVEANYQRQQGLWAERVTSEREYLEAQQAAATVAVRQGTARQKLLRLGVTTAELEALGADGLGDGTGHFTARAPVAGTVIGVQASVGELVEPGKDVVVLGDPSRLWVWADLYEAQLAEVSAAWRSGPLAATVTVEAYPDELFSGTVDVVGAAMEVGSSTVRVRVSLDNPGGRLRPGMFARVRLYPQGERLALVLPAVAVLSDEGRAFVFVHHDGDYFIRRPVQPGRAIGDLVEIESGLTAGQQVVTTGAFLLKSDVLRSKMGAGCAD